MAIFTRVAGRFDAANFNTYQATVATGNTVPAATITNIALTSNVVTFTAVNSLVVGQLVLIAGVTTSTFLNAQTLTVASATATSFTAAFTHANVGSGADTGTAALVQSITVTPTLLGAPTVTTSDGTTFNPFNTNAPIKIGNGPNQETVTPTAVSGNQITAAFANIHGPNDIIISGTFGLQEAINFAFSTNAGGIITVGPGFAGSTSTITSATAQTGTMIEDIRAGATYYFKSGSAYVSGAVLGNPATMNIVGTQQDTVALLAGDGAIPVTAGSYMITKGSAAALTIVAPTAGTDDGKILRVISTTAFLHVITCASDGFNAKGSSGTASFSGNTNAKGNTVILQAYNGHWYTTSLQGVAIV